MNQQFKKLIYFLDKLDKNVVSQKTSPKKVNLIRIKSVGETAFQRAIFNSGKSILKNGGNIKWIDLELPGIIVQSGKRRAGRRIDLIGLLDTLPVICELKYAKSKSNEPPLYAIFELLTYYCSIWYNHAKLDEKNVHHNQDNIYSEFKWKDIIQSKPKLLVCANDHYWEYWKNREIIEEVRKLNEKLNVEILLLKTIEIDFVQMKGEKEFYEPSIPEGLCLEQI